MFLLLFMGVIGAYGCKCVDSSVETYYVDGKVRTIIIRNCEGVIQKYQHLSIEGDSIFELNYGELPSVTSIDGDPWIHLIWNKETYLKGDSIILRIDLATPPEFEIKISANDNKLTKRSLMKEGMNVFEYKCIMNEDVEYINLKALFLHKGKKWITFKKTITIESK